MGQSPLVPVSSTPTQFELVRKEDKFVLISNEPSSTLQSDPSQSCMISFGIDLQTSEKFKHKTLGPTTAKDAREVVRAMQESKVVQADKSFVFVASTDTYHCTAEGMRKAVMEQASRVGEDGLFVFHFSGHGITVRGREWGLAPVDFDYSRATYITASILYEWLQEADCKAKHILVCLDCCYAGGIGNELTSPEQSTLNSSLYVVTACTAYETSLVVGPLGHSIFTYFWARALCMHAQQQPGHFPIKEIFDECHSCSLAFSSLLVTYDPVNESLEWKPHQQPELKAFVLRDVVLEFNGEGQDQTDASTLGRYNYVIKHYSRRYSQPALHDRCIDWLQLLADQEGPLTVLEKRSLLSGNVLEATICSMLYSIAAILMACDRPNIGNPNLYLTAFMHAAATIDFVHSGIDITPIQFLKALAFYDEIVKNSVNDRNLRTLYTRIHASISLSSLDSSGSQSSTSTECGSTDFTDSGDMEVSPPV